MRRVIFQRGSLVCVVPSTKAKGLLSYPDRIGKAKMLASPLFKATPEGATEPVRRCRADNFRPKCRSGPVSFVVPLFGIAKLFAFAGDKIKRIDVYFGASYRNGVRLQLPPK